MTCHETRELFSALVDDALEERERSALDAHLIGCGDCRRELDWFQRTVALVQALPTEHAPSGFVDRVVAHARPAPWPARLLRGLFVPWTMKLPLEAVAVVLVGGLAVWVFQRTPAQQQSARIEQSPPRAEAPSRVEAPARTDAPPPRAARDDAPTRTELVAPPGETPAAPAPSPAPTTLPPTPRESARAEKKETPQAPADVRGRSSELLPPSRAQQPREAPSPESRVARDALDKRTSESPPAAPSAAQALSVPVPADVTGRLTIDDPGGGVTVLADLVRRVGGSVAASRADGDTHLVELLVPRERYPDFAREVARLGRWQAEAESAALPEIVRVRIRLAR